MNFREIEVTRIYRSNGLHCFLNESTDNTLQEMPNPVTAMNIQTEPSSNGWMPIYANRDCDYDRTALSNQGNLSINAT